jgi:hypothetical protein
MANQYGAFVEEAVRGTDPASGYFFIPLMDALQPDSNYDDQPRSEFRGADTGQGDSSVVRRDGQWVYNFKFAYYPGVEIGTLLKHALGFAGTRSPIDTSAYEGILYSLTDIYDTGPLGTTALGFVMNSDEGGTTKAQYYGGGRITSLVFDFQNVDDVLISGTIQGPAEYIGTADQTATEGASFPVASPFSTDDCLFYIGAGISRTGTLPNFTAIAKGTMDTFKPDNLTLTITNGINDKNVMDGVLGPSKTYREAQWNIEVSAAIDYEDPAANFSSADQFKLQFSGPQTSSLLIIMDSGEVAGDTTTTYSSIIDLANAQIVLDTPNRQSDGTQPTTNVNLTSLWSAVAGYAIGFFTTDKASAY